MGCCGKKRSEFVNTLNRRPEENTNSADDGNGKKEPTVRVFEYTGNQSFTLRGTISGKVYYFKHTGERLEVEYHDSFAMMAETNLKLVKK